MSVIVDYLWSAVSQVCWSFWHVFGVTILFSFLLQCVSRRIRKVGVFHFGELYWDAVSPGVICHETGHAVGCLLTGTRIRSFVPFCPQGATLGYVTHEACDGIFGRISGVIISTGPIWFGCIMIVLLSWLFVGDVAIARWSEYFSNDSCPGVISYASSLLRATVAGYYHMATEGLCGLRGIVWMYLSYCIASEIGLSGADLKLLWNNALPVLVIFLCLNITPGLSNVLSVCVFVLMPYMFKIHVLMLSVLGLNVALLFISCFLFCQVK